MKKVTVIYWSNGGNVEALADKVYSGAKESGAEAYIKLVQDASVEDVTSSDAIAFGSPSMDNNKIEQLELEPFIRQFKYLPNKQPIVLFGSYGWDDGKFLKDWKVTMEEYGFNVVGTLTVKETPNEEELEKAFELGKLLAK